MPIYEFYCAENHTVYQFYAKTLAQGKIIPKCPDNPAFSMVKLLSKFAVTSPGKSGKQPPGGDAGGSGQPAEAEDPRMEAAMNAMENEFAHVDENDPRAMGRMMRRMAELTGEKIDGEMEEVVRKLEEGADPDSLEEQLGGGEAGENDLPGSDEPPAPGAAAEAREGRRRFRARRDQPVRDPRLYDYE
ncbi:MAG TPA: FmdB family transcriptional regulator [Opitutaceae bacterium]|jgi:hypothetical protein|nr:FmdB family transcriptional regulator [Opitutaceae bacterium]